VILSGRLRRIAKTVSSGGRTVSSELSGKIAGLSLK
jgi:hypothetical protein